MEKLQGFTNAKLKKDEGNQNTQQTSGLSRVGAFGMPLKESVGTLEKGPEKGFEAL